MVGRVERVWLELVADLLTAAPGVNVEARLAEQLGETFRVRGAAYHHRSPVRTAQEIWPVDDGFGGHRAALSEWAVHRAPTDHPLMLWYLAGGDVRPAQVHDVPDQVADRKVRGAYREFFGPLGLAGQLALPLHHSRTAHAAFVLAREDSFDAQEMRLARTLGRLLVGLDRQAGVLRRHVIAAPAPDVVLTARELAVLGLVADGYTASAVGRRLLIAERTVQKHLQRIYAKLGVRDRLGAVLLAQQIGVLRTSARVRSSGP